MAKHIISAEGLAMVADKEDLYTVIACSDGYDYIVETENGVKVWKVYMPHDEEDDPVVEEKPVLLEDIIPPVTNEKSKKGIKTENGDAPKKKGRKPKVIQETKQEEEIVEKKPVVEKKTAVKKMSPIPESPPIANDAVQIVQPAVEPNGKKKVTKKKPLEEGVEKKLSDYHMFIREFLSKNADIVWNERMKAANAAYRAYKDSLENKV